MKYTRIPTNTFKELQLNAGILVSSFEPATGAIGELLGATTGGVNFTDTVEYKDFGEDIDNCPKNMLELKKLESHEAKLSGTFITLSATTAKRLAGAADVDPNDTTHIIPRNDILPTDFQDIWWVGDYSDVNDGENAGYLALHVINSLNTGGFQLQSTDREKSQYAFEFTGHYSMDAQDTVPFEIYIKEGTATVQPNVNLSAHALTIESEGTATLVATVVPASATVTWSSVNSSVATVSDGVVTAAEVTGTAVNTIITAAITIEGVTYNDTCTIIVEPVAGA